MNIHYNEYNFSCKRFFSGFSRVLATDTEAFSNKKKSHFPFELFPTMINHLSEWKCLIKSFIR